MKSNLFYSLLCIASAAAAAILVIVAAAEIEEKVAVVNTEDRREDNLLAAGVEERIVLNHHKSEAYEEVRIRSTNLHQVLNDDDDGREDRPRRMQQQRQDTSQQPWSPDYYDVLRETADESQVIHQNGSSIYYVPPISAPLQGGVGSVATNNITAYIDVEEETSPTNLADIKAFLHFTYDGLSTFQGTENDAFAVLLAAYHFNNVDSSPVLTPDIVSQCPDLKLTVELLDSEFSPIETTRTFTSVLQRQYTLQAPPPAAVVGAFRSSVTLPLAILSGVNDIPQVSHGATSIEFDDKDQYPLFGRTVTSSIGEAKVAVEFFKSIKSTHVAILFVTGAYGSALQKAFQDAANDANIVTESVALPFYTDQGGGTATGDSKDSNAVEGAIASLKNLKYQHVYAIFSENALETIMTLALKQGAAGRGYLWVFPGLVVDSFKTYNFGKLTTGFFSIMVM